MLLGTLPAGAQVVYAPSASAPISPYTPIAAAMEPQGCPLTGNGQWTLINNRWIWCPPTAGYANSSQAGYGYGTPIAYGYGTQTGYGYGTPTGYGYGTPYGYGSPSGMSLTGSPALDMVLGVTASSLIASQFQPYGQQAYYPGYSQYGQGYPSYGYPSYGQNYPAGYQGYPGYGYSGGNTYTRNVYRYYNGNRVSQTRPPGTMHPYYHPIHNELTWIARDQRRIGTLRAEGGNRAQIAQLKGDIERNQDRITTQRATEQRYDSRVAGRQNTTHNGPISVSRNHFTAPHMATAHIAASRMSAARMDTPRMTAPRMDTPRMSAPLASRGGGAPAQPNGGTRHRPPA